MIGSFAYFVGDRVASDTDRFYFGVGSPTSAAVLPTNGTATYRGVIFAEGKQPDFVLNARYDAIGTMTAVVDFATRDVTVDMDIKEDATSNFRLGTYRFTANAASLPNFRATNAEGALAGFLSGPQGQELVLTFNLTYAYRHSAGYDITVPMVGAAAAKR